MEIMTCQQKRRGQNREAKRRQRERAGCVTVTVEMTVAEYEDYAACRAMARDGVVGFSKKALLRGARFVANSGAGVKRKAPDTSPSEAICSKFFA